MVSVESCVTLMELYRTVISTYRRRGMLGELEIGVFTNTEGVFTGLHPYAALGFKGAFDTVFVFAESR